MIRVSVALLDKQPVELDDEEPVEFLDEEFNGQYEFVSPVRYKLLARKVSGSVLVTGGCSTEICGVRGRFLATMAERGNRGCPRPLRGREKRGAAGGPARSAVFSGLPRSLSALRSESQEGKVLVHQET